MPPWPISASRTVYENRWIRVVEDDVTRPDGSPGIYGVVEVRQPAVFVVALDEHDRVVLVTVDRHTTGLSPEVPAGGTDGEDPLVAARRELLEETGLVAERWREVGRMQALNGICRAPEVVYLATGLSRAAGVDASGDLDAERTLEGISRVEAVPFAEVLGMVGRGEITDGETVAALGYAAIALGRMG